MNEVEILIAKDTDIDRINQVIEKHYSCPPVYYKPLNISEPTDIAKRENNITLIAKKRNDII